MWHYEPPLRDMRCLIEDVRGLPAQCEGVLGLPAQWSVLPAFAELDADTARHFFAYVLSELEHTLSMLAAAAAPLAVLPVPA